MSLIVEDGTGVAGANSYVSLADARLIVADRGMSLPVADAEAEVLLLKAMDWIESKRDRYKGMKTSATQPLQWPRTGVVIDQYDVESDYIPPPLVTAQAILAVQAVDNELFVNTTGQRILLEKVDVLETRYSNSSSTKAQPFFAMVDAFIAPLLRAGYALPTVRV